MQKSINIDHSWKPFLEKEFNKDYMKKLSEFLEEERKKNNIYPSEKEVFYAFNITPFNKVKVVIIGQDPYHGQGQAHGLCFSVKPGITPPPSLKNIYKELQRDVQFTIPNHGNLSSWAKQGVLLLNSVLTVRESQAASHRKKGWEEFTDQVIKALDNERKNLVFLLWGNDAKKKGAKINRKKHLVLESGHPSPLSARFFNGCSHFSKTNQYLKKNRLQEIIWNLN